MKGMSGEEKLFRKAERLIEEGRVIRISPTLFYVLGDHGKYFVTVEEGVVKCLCPGFRRRGVCSHSIAVLLVLLRPDYRHLLEEGLKKRLEAQLEAIKRGEYAR